MNRKAQIFVNNILAGMLSETEEGEYVFQYDEDYLQNPNNLPVSLTLPKRKNAYSSSFLFPFFEISLYYQAT